MAQSRQILGPVLSTLLVLGAIGGSGLAAALLPPAGAAAVTALAVAAVALTLLRRVTVPDDPGDHALRRHLAVCRRREQRAIVLVASVPRRCGAMSAELRISDSAVTETRRGGSVLVAVVDGQETSRERIAERLYDRYGEQLRVGSSCFPDDGLTLDVLVDVAASRAANGSGVPRSQDARPAAEDRR